MELWDEEMAKDLPTSPEVTEGKVDDKYCVRLRGHQERKADLEAMIFGLLMVAVRGASARMEFYSMLVDNGMDFASSAWATAADKSWVAQESGIGRTRKVLREVMETVKGLTKAMAEAEITQKAKQTALTEGSVAGRNR